MLTINRDQLKRFQSNEIIAFEEEMVVHCVEFSPRLSAVLKLDGVRAAVSRAVCRAAAHGLTYKGPVRLFIELCFLFGSSFDEDIQYPLLRRTLGQPDPHTQMQRAEALHMETSMMLTQIHGPENRYTDAALRRLHLFAASPPILHSSRFSVDVVAAMFQIHPQKCACVGEDALLALVDHARAEAARHGLLSLQDALLFVILMFSFGQGCLRDPLYPWIQGTLVNPLLLTPSSRSAQLAKKARTWLRYVLKNREAVP